MTDKLKKFLTELSEGELKSEKTREMTKTELVSFANSKGYDFSLEELISVLDKHHDGQSTVPELVAFEGCTNMTSCWTHCPTP